MIEAGLVSVAAGLAACSFIAFVAWYGIGLLERMGVRPWLAVLLLSIICAVILNTVVDLTADFISR